MMFLWTCIMTDTTALWNSYSPALWQTASWHSFHHILFKIHSFINVLEDWGEFDFRFNPTFWPFPFPSFPAFTNYTDYEICIQTWSNRLCSLLGSSMPLQKMILNRQHSPATTQSVVFINSLQPFVIFNLKYTYYRGGWDFLNGDRSIQLYSEAM